MIIIASPFSKKERAYILEQTKMKLLDYQNGLIKLITLTDQKVHNTLLVKLPQLSSYYSFLPPNGFQKQMV